MTSTSASINLEEHQYLSLITEITEHGNWQTTRNGKTKSVFGGMMKFSLENGQIPILTTKRTAWKTCLKELLWFIRGDTDNATLRDQNVHIWDANSSSDALKERGLNYAEGILGPIYGFQWRHFNGDYNSTTGRCSNVPSANKGVDQLGKIIEQLKDPASRTSRRLVMSAWNPAQLDDMALPPCHILCQFNVHDEDKLSCALYQRSCDVGLGVPFNIASYSFLTSLIAKHCGLVPHTFVYFLGNAHIYDDHIEQLSEQATRSPLKFPTLNIRTTKPTIEEYEVDDFEVSGYEHLNAIAMKMRK